MEFDKKAAEEARPHLETMDLADTLRADRFDVFLFGGVLEHLRDPGGWSLSGSPVRR